MACAKCGRPHGDGCRAHNRAGEPCRQRPMRGQRVCKAHGGMTPGARENAAKRLQEAEAAKLVAKVWNPDAAPVTDSVGEMQRLAGSMREAVDILGAELSAGGAERCEHCGRTGADMDSVHAAAWVRVLRELRTILADMERLGIAHRHIELAQGQADLVLVAVAGMLEVLRPSPADRDRAVGVFLQRLGLPGVHDVPQELIAGGD